MDDGNSVERLNRVQGAVAFAGVLGLLDALAARQALTAGELETIRARMVHAVSYSGGRGREGEKLEAALNETFRIMSEQHGGR